MLKMTKSICYYTDNRLGEPIYSIAQKFILESGLPIVSASLKPINFGDNEVVKGERSYPTMVKQIISCLERSTADYVFFCENDVLYHSSHFDFTPQRDDIYYYNINNYRWLFGSNTAITYSGLTSLSMMCCNRQLAINHYKLRFKKIEELGLDKIRSREPRWIRRWGYEPGTKKRRRGGFTDEDFGVWRSEYPNVDIRHKRTFSSPKITLDSFKYPPSDWTEITIDQIPYWDLKEMFKP